LRTHPDKNPDNAHATAEFQRLSEAYNLLLRHLDRSSSPSLGFFPSFSGYDYDDFDDSFEEDVGYDPQEELQFYKRVFT
jgi:curved DNA-binding protein CbpA